MYRGFDLRIIKDFFGDKFDEYHLIGSAMIKKDKESVRELLSKYIKDGIIDGNRVEDELFKKEKADIFISYSHNDADLVKAIAGWLNSELGLKVFFDEVLWGQADDLLRKIDEKYCLNEDGNTFSYPKRNFSTSHVHSMLAVSIMKMIDLSECILFINTDESIPKIEEQIEGKSYTMSPWIYLELSIINKIQIKNPEVYRRKKILEYSQSNQKLKVKYEADFSRLTNLETEMLKKWKERFSMGKCLNKDIHALDILYRLIEDNPN